MELSAGKRRFLVDFAHAALGLGEDERGLAEATVARLLEFLAASPESIRQNFVLALKVVPPKGFARRRFMDAELQEKRRMVDAAFREQTGRAPGLLIDLPAVLGTVKSLLGGAYAELPEFWRAIGYSPVPSELPRRDGRPIVPPTGESLRPGRSAAATVLHERAVTVREMKRRIDGRRTLVIVGSGAGGLCAAWALKDHPDLRGVEIVILEAGPLRTNESFPTRTLDAFGQLYFRNGVTPSSNLRMSFVQGRCVGGSTTINNAGCLEPENEWWDDLKARWGRLGAALDWDAVKASFRELEGPLHVSPTDDAVITEAARRTFRSFDELQDRYTRAGVIPSNLVDCIGCGQCNLGCRYDAHAAPYVTLLPSILERDNVSLVPEAPVTRLGFSRRRHGRSEPRSVTFVDIETADGIERITPDWVILAASSFNSSKLLLKSRFTGRDDDRWTVGKRFTCNFASPVVGRFEERLDGGAGQQIGYVVEVPDRRMVLESAFAPPTVMGMLMPHWGSRFREVLHAYNHFAVFFPTLAADATGRIRTSLLQGTQIDFELADTDWERLSWGLRTCAEALRRAGASEIMDSRFSGETVTLGGDDAEDRDRLDAYFQGLGPSHFVKVQSGHLQGGCVIAEDPREGVVGPDLKAHGVRNLWIMDSSVFPAPITLNIQFTVMALAHAAARRLRL